jgi:ABC-type glycerol-3-phosphate transport system permease component
MAKENNIIGKIILYFFLIFMVVVTLIPIAYTVSASFKTNTEIMSGGIHLIPKKFTINNFVTAWTMGSSGGSAIGRKPVTFADYTVNSIILSSITVIGTVIFTSMSAYCFQRGDFPGRKMLYNIFLATMFISAGSISIFPIVKLATKFAMNNLYGASVVQIFTTSAANLFLTIGYMKTIDKEIDNAAKIDGCSFFRTYYNIILPLCKPILATIALLSFRHSWNDYLLPMVFTTGKTAQYPLVVGVVALKSFGGEGAAQYNLLMAGTMFSLVPVITIYIAMNRYFVAGITEGALKG